MEHSRILEKNSKSNIYIDYDDSSEIKIKKYQIQDDDTFFEIPAETLTYNNVFWTGSIQMPNEDCYVAIIIYKEDIIIDYIILRNGTPLLKSFYTNKDYVETDIVTYEQYNKNADLIDSGELTYLISGIGYFNCLNEFESLVYFNRNNEIISSVLKLPYMHIKICDGSGYTADGLFMDTGFGNFGFIGNKYSYFDLDAGKWIDDENKLAKAEDLAKAVCNHYNLEWTDRTNPLHIYNYIKYFRTYDEEDKVFRLYVPSITPTDNPANFPLIEEDELGNTFIKGVSMLTVQDLETVQDGSVGTYMPFK